MASNTYLKTPPAFEPSTPFELELHYDDTLIYTVAELTISGFDITYNTDTHYTGFKKVKLLTGSGNDTTFPIASNEILPNCPDDWTEYGLWGIDATTYPTAQVTFYTAPYEITKTFTYDENNYVTNFDSTKSGVTFKDTTAKVVLNIILLSSNSFTFPTIKTQVSTTTQIALEYTNHDCLGMNNGDSVYTYIFDIYDANTNKLVYQSPQYFDWSDEDITKLITVENLQDGSTYYIQADIGMLCGYCITARSNNFSVDINKDIEISDRMTLINRPYTGAINLIFDTNGLTYTNGVLERSLFGTNNWLRMQTFTNNKEIIEGKFIYQDFFVTSEEKYIYRIVLYNDNELVDTYQNYIEHICKGVCICDNTTSYVTEAEVSYYPISKNERLGVQAVKDARYPTVYNTTLADYCNGSVSGAFAVKNQYDECEEYKFTDDKENAEFRLAMLDWLNNGQAKFLKYDNGLSFIVAITGTPTIESGETDGMAIINFDWVEIADKKKLSNFENLGLLVIK